MFRSAFIHSVACLACLAVSFSTLARTFSQPNTQEIQWIDDFPTAIRYATSNNLPLMLHFYGDNCPPCRLLEKKAFRDPQLIGKINGQLVAVRINGEKQKELRDRYQVTRWPTDVYLLPNGEEIYRTVSPQDPSVYGQMVDRVALRHRDWKAGEVAAAQANEQRLANRTSTQIAMDRRPTSSSMASSSSHPVLNTAPGPSAATLPQQPASGFQQPALVAQQSTPHPSTMPQTVAPQTQRVIANPHLAGGPILVPPAAPMTPQPAPQAPAAPEVKVAGVPATTIANQSTATVEPSVGLDGFCPVSLFHGAKSTDPNRVVWTEGSPKFAVKHRGRIYLCASEAYRQEFLRAPDLYAPCLSCYDLIHYIKTQQLVNGKCEFGCFQADTGRVFLFASQEHCDEFRRNESYYSQLIQNGSGPERVAAQPDGLPVR